MTPTLRTAHSTGIFVSLLLFGALSVGAQSSSEPRVRISQVGSTFLIKILQPTPLRAIIASLCQESGALCTGTENVQYDSVPVMTMKGTWKQVLVQLLAGTGLNYIFTERGLDSTGSLLIEKSTQAASEGPTDLSSLPPRPAQNVDPDTTMSNLSGSEVLGQPSITGNDDVSVSASDESSISRPAGYLPFPDSNGHPIPANDKSSGGLPFGDINVTPESTGSPKFLPFPGSSGKPVPVRPTQPGTPFPIGRD